MIMMNHSLRLFIRVADIGSITEVANEHYISQPAVSKAIKNIENELNVTLFHRDKRNGLILTDVGKKILSYARQMEETENRIYQAAFRENNFLGGKVKIASMPIITSVILSKAFKQYRQRYPHVTIELIEGSSAFIRKAVDDHQVDFGLTASPFGVLDYKVLLKDKMVAISNTNIHTPIKLMDRPDRFILCKAGHETATEKLKPLSIALDRSFIVEEAETVIAMVEAENGIGIISDFVLLATPNHLIKSEIHPQIEIDIGIIALSLSDLTPVASEMKRIIEDISSKL